MTYINKPKLKHPLAAVNELGYSRRYYEGAVSTLCAGCGHDSISAGIIQAFFELSIEPHRVAKLSEPSAITSCPDSRSAALVTVSRSATPTT